jgi:hypothetical protein
MKPKNPSRIEKIIKYIKIIASLFFLFQAITKIQIINIYPIIEFLGIPPDIVGIALLIMCLGVLAVVVGFFLSFLNKYGIVKGATRNRITLQIIVNWFFLFITFLPSFFFYDIFINHSLDNRNLDTVSFLNVYLFFYFLISAYFGRGEIDAESGLTEKEKDGLI